MPTPKQLDEILTLQGDEFALAFSDYLTDKKINGEPMRPLEEEAWLVTTMLSDIEMEGFVDLFYQHYSLRECAIVESTLKLLGLQRLAALFTEAKNLYVDGRSDITEAEYQDINPFAKNDRWSRFDAIGKEILAKGSEIYLLTWERVEAYVKERLCK